MDQDHTDRIDLVMSTTVRPVEDDEFGQIIDVLVAAALPSEQVEFLNAAPAPILNGRPRMLHVSGWMVHEGRNENGDLFIAEELKELVENRSLFRGAYAGVIDFNHDFVPRGYWYDAQFGYDEKAQAFGILAHGAVWAWLYPEFADQMLAEQTRNGDVKLSNSLLVPRSQTEITVIGDGLPTRIVHYPTFMATSLLNKRPADPAGRGLVDDDASLRDHTARQAQLLVAASEDGALQEEIDMDEMKNVLTEALAGLGLDERLGDVVTTIQASVDAQMASLRDELQSRDTAVTDAVVRAEAAEALIQQLTASLAERDLAIETLTATTTALETRVAEFEAAAVEAARIEAERQFQARTAARLAELPEEITERLSAKPEDVRNSIVQMWAELDDEQWKVKREELMLTAGNRQTVVRLPGMPSTEEHGRVDLGQFIQTRS